MRRLPFPRDALRRAVPDGRDHRHGRRGSRRPSGIARPSAPAVRRFRMPGPPLRFPDRRPEAKPGPGRVAPPRTPSRRGPDQRGCRRGRAGPRGGPDGRAPAVQRQAHVHDPGPRRPADEGVPRTGPARPCAPHSVQWRGRPPGARRQPSGRRLSIMDSWAGRSASARGSGRISPGPEGGHPTAGPPGPTASGSFRPGASASRGRTPVPVTVAGLPSCLGQPSRPRSPRGRAQARHADAEALLPEPPDGVRGYLSGTDVHRSRPPGAINPIRAFFPKTV